MGLRGSSLAPNRGKQHEMRWRLMWHFVVDVMVALFGPWDWSETIVLVSPAVGVCLGGLGEQRSQGVVV